MKKVLLSAFILLPLCAFMSTLFIGCDRATGTNEYSIEMENEDWLYEKIPSSATVGETVTVKIRSATDLGYIFTVNGEQIEQDDVESNEYWQFSFTMPDEDVIIDFKTYDGFLPDIAYGTLIETYWMRYPDAEYVSVREYYGEYDGNVLAAMIDAGDITANEWSEEVAGCIFQYGDGNRVTVLCNGKFYTLPEAYKKELITEESVREIFSKYSAIHDGAYIEVKEPSEKDVFLKKAEEIREYANDRFENAITQHDLNAESGAVREKWDALLSEVQEYLKQELSESEYKELQDSEAEWLIAKEKAINDAAEEWKGGSGEPMARNMAATSCMEERFNYLISLLD